MMRGIIKSSMNLRFLVILLAAALIVVGVIRLRTAPVDILPEFSPPYVEIQTEALGLSAEEVDQLITLGLEQDLLNGVPWLSDIRSESLPGLSSITLIFEPGTDLIRARQMVSERLAQAFALPHVSKPPTMLQPLSSSSRVLIVGLSSKDLSLIKMSELARWTIVPRVMGVPGVANVAIWGQRDRQLQVQVDPKLLADHNVSLLQVLETTGNALWVSSLSFVEASTPGTGGFIDSTNQRLGIRHILPIVSSEGLAKVPIGDTGVLLGDVSKVVEDHQPLIGDALTNGTPGLLLVIEKFPGANTLEVTRGVETALNELRPGMGGLNIDTSPYRPADFIEMAVSNLGMALLIGFSLILLIIIAFFFNWRATLVSLLAIPLSFLAANLVLSATGATINIIILTGFLIATGVIVEDAIIDVENIVRRLNLARDEGSTKSTANIILEASFEVRSPINYALLILLLAVTPLFFIGGVTGAFFQPLAISYGLALLASTIVALTLTPGLCLILFGNAPAERRVSPLVINLQRSYERGLGRIIHKSGLIFAITGALIIIGFSALPSFRQSLIPSFDERDLLVHLSAIPGTSQSEMSRISGRVSQELKSIAGVRNVSAQIGRAIFGDQVVNVNAAELWVSIEPSANYDNTISAIQDVVHGYPGIHSDVQTYLNEIAGDIMPQSKNSLTVRVYGDTDETLHSTAENVQKTLTQVDGVESSTINLPVQQPTLEIEVDLEAAQKYGIKPGDVRRTAATLFSGLQVGSLFEEQKVFDVVVWSTPETRQSLSDILNMPIDTPDGGQVKLSDVAKVRVAPTLSVIRHEAVHRYIDVVAQVGKHNISAVAANINSHLQQMQFPLEYHAEVLGGSADQQNNLTRFLVIAIAAVVGIFLLLQSAFKSWRLAFLAIVTLPLAISGGLLAVFLTGSTLSLGSIAGFLAILGFAIRNGIVMTSHFNHLERNEGVTFGLQLVLRGSRERLPSTLMTALATMLAFIPALFLGNIPGLEIIRPMAVVFLGGMVTTSLLDLLVFPVLYLRYGGKREPDLEISQARAADLPAITDMPTTANQPAMTDLSAFSDTSIAGD